MTTTISTDIHTEPTTKIDGSIYRTFSGYRATVSLDNATIYLDPAELDRLLGVLLATRATINQKPDLARGKRHEITEDDYLVTTRHLSHHEQIRLARGDRPAWLGDTCGTEGPVLVSKVVTR